jgi:phage terminase Nu1 subunit (DNA packaging protein)
MLCPFGKQTVSEGATPAEALAEVPLERMAEAENWTLAEALRNKEIKNALLKELEYDRARGHPVKIEDIQPAWARVVLAVRSAMLTIPGKARFQLPHLTAHDLDVLVRSSATRAASAAQCGRIERN